MRMFFRMCGTERDKVHRPVSGERPAKRVDGTKAPLVRRSLMDEWRDAPRRGEVRARFRGVRAEVSGSNTVRALTASRSRL